jgi:hypothetical protein
VFVSPDQENRGFITLLSYKMPIMFSRVPFPLAPFSAIASLSSKRNAVSKSSALTMNRFPWWCAAALSFVGYPAGSSTIRTRGSLLRASLGFSLCPEKKEADAAAYDSGPYK